VTALSTTGFQQGDHVGKGGDPVGLRRVDLQDVLRGAKASEIE
jgi:hypothetical protein